MSLDVTPLLDELSHAHSESAATITATMTFVVFVEDPAIADWVRSRSHAVAEKHPSRVIFFDATRGESQRRLETPSGRSEWLEVGVAGSGPQELASALSALALHEAPTVLAWMARDVATDDRFSTLTELADVVIVSTSAVDPDDRQLRELVKLLDQKPDCDVHDVAYLRIGAWQEIIAQLFDEPQFATELANVRTVEMTCGSDAEMYYLLGWLASRLEWSPCSEDEFCNASGAAINFSLKREGSPRRLERVAMHTQAFSFIAELLPEDPNVARLTIHGLKQPSEHLVPLRGLDIASLVERALLAKRRDEMFRESLAMAKRILQRRRAPARRDPGELRVCESPAELAHALASTFADAANQAIAQRGRFTVALAGGTTPKAAYHLLAQPPYSVTIPWQSVIVFFGDERCVPPDDEQSNYRAAREALLARVPIPEANVHRMRGEDDPPAAARAYREALVATLGSRPRFDLVMLGMGEDGHTASLFPGEDPLTDDEALVRAAYAKSRQQWRLTLTPQVLNAASLVVFAVEGPAKAAALKAVREGPYDPVHYPAQIVVPSTGHLLWLADRDAAGS
jgi:6-phosphogluconolactonase